MIDFKIFTFGGPWGGGQGCVIRSEKWENYKKSTHTKIKFYVIFIYIFFLWLILKFLQMGGGGRGGVFFTCYYVINVMIKTLMIISFIVVYIIYFTHIVHIDVLWCVFPFSWKDYFWLREKYLLPQFLSYKVETHIIL